MGSKFQRHFSASGRLGSCSAAFAGLGKWSWISQNSKTQWLTDLQFPPRSRGNKPVALVIRRRVRNVDLHIVHIAVYHPRCWPYSEVDKYRIWDNIDLILAWVQTNPRPSAKLFVVVQKPQLGSNPGPSDPGAKPLTTALYEEWVWPASANIYLIFTLFWDGSICMDVHISHSVWGLDGKRK